MNKTPKQNNKKGKKEPAKREAIGQGINTDVEERIPNDSKPSEPQMDLGDVSEFVGGGPVSGVVDSDDFGDDFGDIDMFKECKYGVALGNGKKEVKEIATFVTKTIDESGVAHALKHFKIID
jgi:hypothetical protein